MAVVMSRLFRVAPIQGPPSVYRSVNRQETNFFFRKRQELNKIRPYTLLQMESFFMYKRIHVVFVNV